MRNLSGEGEDRIYTLGNAFITDAQHDTADYTSSDPILWTITVRYETLDTTDFAGKPKTIQTGIAKKEKPKKETPVPPSVSPPDAKINNESEPPMYTDPMGTTDGAAIMAAAGNSPARSTPQTNWPSGSSNPTYDAMGNVTGSNYSPSTGSNEPSQTSSQPTHPLTSSQQTFVDKETAAVNSNPALNDKWKESYIRNLKENPPLSNDPVHVRDAQETARLFALKDAPMYSSQTRTVDNGVYTDRSTINPGQPGTSNTGVNNTQLSRENNANNNRAQQTQRIFN
jgi:hypothetical protein